MVDRKIKEVPYGTKCYVCGRQKTKTGHLRFFGWARLKNGSLAAVCYGCNAAGQMVEWDSYEVEGRIVHEDETIYEDI